MDFEEDLAKYDDENHEKASVIYRTIPEQLENKNSHFKFSMVDKNARYKNARYKNYVDSYLYVDVDITGGV